MGYEQPKPLSPQEMLAELDADKNERNTKLRWQLVREGNLSADAEVDSTSNAHRDILSLTITEKGVTTKFALVNGRIALAATERWSLSDENEVQTIVEEMHKNHTEAAVTIFGLTGSN